MSTFLRCCADHVTTCRRYDARSIQLLTTTIILEKARKRKSSGENVAKMQDREGGQGRMICLHGSKSTLPFVLRSSR